MLNLDDNCPNDTESVFSSGLASFKVFSSATRGARQREAALVLWRQALARQTQGGGLQCARHPHRAVHHH